MQIENTLINDHLRVSKITENFAFNYLKFCCNLPVKFANFLKSSLLFTVSVVFSAYKQNFAVL